MFGMIRGYWSARSSGRCRTQNPRSSCKWCPSAMTSSPTKMMRTPSYISASPCIPSVGLISAMSDGRFGLTQLGGKLRSKVPGSCMTSRSRYRSATGFRGGRTGRRGFRSESANTGDARSRAFSYYAENPDEAASRVRCRICPRSCRGPRRVLDTVQRLRTWSISAVRPARHCRAPREHPALHGTFLELADVVPRAGLHSLSVDFHRACQVWKVSSRAVPPADTIILKQIIHDWDDDRAFGYCPTARVRATERARHSDRVRASGRTGVLLRATYDLNMLVLLPGCERTAKQYSELSTRPVFA